MTPKGKQQENGRESHRGKRGKSFNGKNNWLYLLSLIFPESKTNPCSIVVFIKAPYSVQSWKAIAKRRKRRRRRKRKIMNTEDTGNV